MPSTEKTVSTCPACQSRSFVDHCESKACGWNTCRNKDCDLVLDVAKGRGHRLAPNRTSPGAREKWSR